ncbi:hypothetical protein F5X98DRAFT_383953 [Xylaria grammica]|nr:hypothetical protein F5X98DRAFT_383953 [Xylaria grammica]
MSSSTQAASKQDSAKKKKKNKGSYALGLVSQAGTAAKKAWEQGTIIRTPKELFTQYNPLDHTELYSYSPLPTATSIRLLEVSASNPGDLIQCRLHTVDLRHNPRYIALSYSWEKDESWAKFAASFAGQLLGSAVRHVGINLPKSQDSEADAASTGNRVMMCDGKKMIIKPNLYDALLQIRQTTPGYYWVDAVLSEIYRSAESVTVWLGKCPQLLSSGVARFEAAQGDLGPMEKEDEQGGKKQMLGDDSEQYAFIGAAYLLSRRWFGRLWVLQEFCLARRIIIRFGEHFIRPETVVGLIKSFKYSLEGKGGENGKGKNEFGFTNVFRPFWGLHIKFVPPLLESREFFQQGLKWSLEEWLRLTNGRCATDNRDFVNAGLALIREASLTIDQSMQLEDSFPSSPSGPRLWPRLYATAGVEKFEVMLNLAACVLTQTQSAFLLSMGSLGGDVRLPSWVPDPGSQSDGFSGLDALARTLIVDTLMDVDPVMSLIEYLNTEVPRTRRKLNILSKPKPQQSGLEGYLARKMESRSADPSPEEAKTLAARLDEAWTKLKSTYPDKPWATSEAKPKREPSSDLQNFAALAVKVNGWRSLFLTHEGLLGLAGSWVEAGQVVMLVEGGYVPYIFGPAEAEAKRHVKNVGERLEKLAGEPQPLPKRKREIQAELKGVLDSLQSRMGTQSGAWALQGEAYVHGVMRGEAMDGSRVFEPIAIH